MNSSTFCPPNGDSYFGPQVEPCLRSFDFTLHFENLFLSIAPSALFLIVAPIRIFALRNTRKRVLGGSVLRNAKLVSSGMVFTSFPLISEQGAIVLFGILQLLLLVLWCLVPVERTGAAVSAATLSLIDTVVFCFLSYVEHGRNIRPSAILGSYLFFSLLFDIVRVRTLWLIGQDTNEARVFTTSVVLKVCILCLEVKEKRAYLTGEDKLRGPEELSGVLSQGAFYWLNGLIMRGYRRVLSLEDLYPLDEQLSAKTLYGRFSGKWENCKISPTNESIWVVDNVLRAATGRNKHRLLLQSAIAFKWELLAPVLPRLILLALTMCQPLLLNRFVNYLSETEASESANIGYGLIAAYGLVYLGLAVSGFPCPRNKHGS